MSVKPHNTTLVQHVVCCHGKYWCGAHKKVCHCDHVINSHYLLFLIYSYIAYNQMEVCRNLLM